MTEHRNDVLGPLTFAMIEQRYTKSLLEIGLADGQFALGIAASSFTRIGDFWSAAIETEPSETAWTNERDGLAGLVIECIALGCQGSIVDDRITRFVNKIYPSPSLRHCYTIQAPRWLPNAVTF